MKEQITSIANTTSVDELKLVKEELRSKSLLLLAVKTMSSELTKVMDLGEAVDLVNRYLWELLDYKVATYVIYNYAQQTFESRAYLKESVDKNFLDMVQESLFSYLKENSKDVIVGGLSSLRSTTNNVLLFGVPLSDSTVDVSRGLSQIMVPLNVGGKMVGVLNLTSTRENAYSAEDQNIVELLIHVASVSIARINTVIQSLNSRTESLVESLSDGVVMFDTQLHVTLANDIVTKFTGLPKEGYSLKELSKLFEDIRLISEVEKSIDTDNITKIPRASFSRFFYEISIVPVKNYSGKMIGGAIVFHDITHIVEVDRAKTEFVSLASHQLKTPLSSIRWYTEMLMDENMDSLSDTQREYLQVVYDSNLRMIDLVGALLNVSRIELGTFAIDPEPTDLVTLANSVVDELEHKIVDKNQTLKTDYQADLGPYNADRGLLRMIIQNLLSNAIKYSPPEGEISLKISSDNQYLCVTVADNGYGIPKNQQSMIFSKLFRADNIQNKETDGTGLGLYIVKSIVDIVGGSIHFDSVEGKGTTFYILLPIEGMKERSGTKTLEEHVPTV